MQKIVADGFRADGAAVGDAFTVAEARPFFPLFPFRERIPARFQSG